MSPLRNLLRGKKMSHRKTHLRSEITGGTRIKTRDRARCFAHQTDVRPCVYNMTCAVAFCCKVPVEFSGEFLLLNFPIVNGRN